MRSFVGIAGALAGGVMACVLGSTSAEAASATCKQYASEGLVLSTGPSATVTLTFAAGESLVIRTTAPDTELFAPVNLSSSPGAHVLSYTVPGSGQVTFSIVAGEVFVQCLNATAGNGASAAAQQAVNAYYAHQAAEAAIGMYLWSILEAFVGLTPPWEDPNFDPRWGNQAATPARPPAGKLQSLSAMSRVKRLQGEEQELADELAETERGPQADALSKRLETLRHDLMFARVTADLNGAVRGQSEPVASGGQSNVFSLTERTEPGSLPASSASHQAPSMRVTASDVAALGKSGEEAQAARDVLGKRWDFWAGGRLAGSNDAIAQSNLFGFSGAVGASYRLKPWALVGLSLGGETFETKMNMPWASIGSFGVTVSPYTAVRLDKNIVLGVFGGITWLNYTSTPAQNDYAQFGAMRYFVGGALQGTWHDGRWRIQPSLTGYYGSETQNAYTDSQSTAVPQQTITYGHIAAGPEVGYRFDFGEKSSFEPFGLVRGNIDFSSSTTAVVNSAVTYIRPGTNGSASVGGGFRLNLPSGGYFRLQTTYDSLGIPGLDIWGMQLGGGMTF